MRKRAEDVNDEFAIVQQLLGQLALQSLHNLFGQTEWKVVQRFRVGAFQVGVNRDLKIIFQLEAFSFVSFMIKLRIFRKSNFRFVP